MQGRDFLIFAALGFAVWLSGAVMFRFGGHLMFESGPRIMVLSALGIAISVCILLRASMDWRKASTSQSLTIAVVMALPGLFGDVAYVSAFHTVTGLKPETATIFAATIIFGNAILLSYALGRSSMANG